MKTTDKVIERPILFSSGMVRAILNDSKTQTRRILKPEPTAREKRDGRDVVVFSNIICAWRENKPLAYAWDDYGDDEYTCRYGKPGDVLWVREDWNMVRHYKGLTEECYLIFKADYDSPGSWDWKPSSDMPREVCRIRLEITDIGVERLQDISETDAKAEGSFLGTYRLYGTNDYQLDINEHGSYKEGYRFIWSQINGADSWNKNPWVWKIGFSKIKTLPSQ